MSFLDWYQAAFSHQILENPRNWLKKRERGLQNICLSSGEKRKSAAQKPSVDRKYDSHKHTNRWGGAVLQVPRIKPQWKTTEREGKRGERKKWEQRSLQRPKNARGTKKGGWEPLTWSEGLRENRIKRTRDRIITWWRTESKKDMYLVLRFEFIFTLWPLPNPLSTFLLPIRHKACGGYLPHDLYLQIKPALCQRTQSPAANKTTGITAGTDSHVLASLRLGPKVCLCILVSSVPSDGVGGLWGFGAGFLGGVGVKTCIVAVS